MRILGIDPGSRKTGFGIITQQGSQLTYVTSGCIRLTELETFPERLQAIYSTIKELIYQYQPEEFAIEQIFIGRNPASALKLGHARGSAIVAATSMQLPVFEYAARQVKQAVVGRGDADKTQIQHMIKHLLKLPGYPQEDAADALAVAVSHANMKTSMARVGAGQSARRGRIKTLK